LEKSKSKTKMERVECEEGTGECRWEEIQRAQRVPQQQVALKWS